MGTFKLSSISKKLNLSIFNVYEILKKNGYSKNELNPNIKISRKELDLIIDEHANFINSKSLLCHSVIESIPEKVNTKYHDNIYSELHVFNCLIRNENNFNFIKSSLRKLLKGASYKKSFRNIKASFYSIIPPQLFYMFPDEEENNMMKSIIDFFIFKIQNKEACLIFNYNTSFYEKYIYHYKTYKIFQLT